MAPSEVEDHRLKLQCRKMVDLRVTQSHGLNNEHNGLRRKAKIQSVNLKRISTEAKPYSQHKRQCSYKIVTITETTSFPVYRQVAKLSMATSMRTFVLTAGQFIAEKI